MKPVLIVAGGLLGSALLSPALLAQEEKRTTTTTTTTETHRYYDPVEKDYHDWNQSEDKAYRLYLGERRHDYVDFDKANEKERKEYYKWRHGHPDSVTIKEKDRH